jgi:biopolymer transport protein ExbD
MLVLVFMFMAITQPHSFHHGPPVDLARVHHPVLMRAASREDAIIVVIRRDNRIYFRNEAIMPDQLAAKIRQSIDQGSERKVYIWADAGARYRWVGEVLEGVRSAGVEKVGFLVGLM